MGLMPLLAGLLAASTSSVSVVDPARDCIASDPGNPSLCIRSTPRAMSPYRLSADAPTEYNRKMDAMRVNPRPCRLVGNLDCPGKGRVLMRSNERNWLDLRPVNPLFQR